ncbi:MAG: TIGR00296 family protein [Methanomassiliicoccaceae archaeon]|jgi:uncharacterized protein (TIGR00296 family)|nr:TIGR00296 family protein [Methanomassiliicoccaceae archaeon]
MNIGEGEKAVRFARNAVCDEVTFCGISNTLPAAFDRPSGVFVTLNTYPSLELRGCIGYPGPAYPLKRALELSARSACHDPRFPDLDESELDHVVVEVTILTPPEPMAVKRREDLIDMIKIGKHGLMIEYRGRTGVFLPQVPVEWDWNVLEYLENLCRKAGIPKDAWKEQNCNIYSFEGRIFKETSPNGDIAEVKE